MKLRHVAALLLVSGLGACAQQQQPPQQPTTAGTPRSSGAAAAPGALDPQALRSIESEIRAQLEEIRTQRFVGMDDGPVPDFDVHTADGARLSSKSLVGRRAFVVVFFATWCDSCGHKLKSLQQAVRELDAIRVIPVSLDGPETWTRVPDYLRSFEVREPFVLALQNPRFATSYNPFQAVPLLVIVGKNGGLVDYQLGNELEQEERLMASLRLAETIGPLAPPSRPDNGSL